MTIILYAFNMQQHRSLYGKKCLTVDQLDMAIRKALIKGAEVISIRVYRDNKGG